MNALLQESLLGTKHINHAVIIRRKDGHVKAKSPGLTVSLCLTSQFPHSEFQKIETAFSNPADLRTNFALLTILDISYKAVRADELSIYAKNQDKNGIIIARTANHYIVGTYDSTMYASVAAEAVEKLGSF